MIATSAIKKLVSNFFVHCPKNLNKDRIFLGSNIKKSIVGSMAIVNQNK
jgi:hypothetical protein